MQHYTSSVTDTFGNAVSGATINVYAAGTTTPSTIYSNNSGTTTPNPLTSGADGTFDFYAADGRYDLVITHPSHTFTDADTAGIALYDPASLTTGQLSGNWTPSVGGNATYTAQFGTWNKNGKIIYVACVLIINTIGTGSTNTISGLQHPNGTNPTLQQALTVGVTLGLAVSPVSLNPVLDGSTIVIYGRTAAANGISLQNVLGNGAQIEIYGSYRTD